MRRVGLLMILLTAPGGCSKILGFDEVSLGDPPRLLAPQSSSIVTQQRPTLRWAPGTVDGTHVVELCRDRSCMEPLGVAAQLGDDRVSAVPSAALSPGWVFWRVRVLSGSQVVTSATWQFWVGHASASSPVDTGNGAVLDVNGDGHADLLVGAHGAGSDAGAAHLYLGSAAASAVDWNATSTATRIDLSSPAGDSAAFGYSVSSAGDINGDGFADFLIGSHGADSSSGTAHLYFGSPTPLATNWNGATAASRIDLDHGDGKDATFGASVSGAGDVNGDGYADFLIGASKANTAHLYFGSGARDATGWNGSVATGRVDLSGPEPSSAFGSSVAGAGDVNGDGHADFVIGADGAGAGTGAAYLYLGFAAPNATAWRGSGLATPIALTSPDGPGSSFGSAVAAAGDVNGDGYSDVLAGARSAGPATGSVHLYLGSAIPNASEWNGDLATRRFDLLAPDGEGAIFGSSVASAGDVNGDGYTDLLIGAEGVGAGSGAAHVYLGAQVLDPMAWSGAAPRDRVDLVNTDGSGSRFGASVAGTGDIDGDGHADFLVGARDASARQGAAHVYFGLADPSPDTWTSPRIDLTNPAGANARFGVSVAHAAPPARVGSPAKCEIRVF